MTEFPMCIKIKSIYNCLSEGVFTSCIDIREWVLLWSIVVGNSYCTIETRCGTRSVKVQIIE